MQQNTQAIGPVQQHAAKITASEGFDAFKKLFELSGNDPEVAKAFGVSASRLYGWRRQLAAEGLGDDEQALPVFAQVEVSEPIAQRELTAGFLDDCAPAPAIGSVVVDLPSGARVRIEGIADPGVIAAVLGELDR